MERLPSTISRQSQLPLLFQSRGILTSRDIQSALRVSQPRVSQLIEGLGDQIIRLGRRRLARYALKRPIRHLGTRWPIYRMDAGGKAMPWANLHSIYGGFWLEMNGPNPTWIDRDYPQGIFPGLPFFMNDLRPQGFLGRALARAVAGGLGVPNDPRKWVDDDVLMIWLSHGDDLPGDLVIGERMIERALSFQAHSVQHPDEATPESQRVERYAIRAQKAMEGEMPASSAGGERPKFTEWVRRRDGRLRKVLVKFSPFTNTEDGQRWADLLLAEALALGVLASQGLPAATAQVIEGGNRRFLEVERFDRTEVDGRCGIISLSSVEAGLLDRTTVNWATAAQAMTDEGLLGCEDAKALRRLWCFGNLIGNTDMHSGNVSFWFDDNLPLRLAPAYDMLPMTFAPTAHGEVPARPFAPLPPSPSIQPEWNEAAIWAAQFWQQAQNDARLSAEFRALAKTAGEKVDSFRRHFGS